MVTESVKVGLRKKSARLIFGAKWSVKGGKMEVSDRRRPC